MKYGLIDWQQFTILSLNGREMRLDVRFMKSQEQKQTKHICVVITLNPEIISIMFYMF